MIFSLRSGDGGAGGVQVGAGRHIADGPLQGLEEILVHLRVAVASPDSDRLADPGLEGPVPGPVRAAEMLPVLVAAGVVASGEESALPVPAGLDRRLSPSRLIVSQKEPNPSLFIVCPPCLFRWGRPGPELEDELGDDVAEFLLGPEPERLDLSDRLEH